MNKDNILILDIETTSEYNIRSQFSDYVRTAKCKWIGFYSYTSGKYYNKKVQGNEHLIKKFIAAHDVIVTFNGDSFDIPILQNCKLWPNEYKTTIDLMVVLGNGKLHKKRGALMGYKFRRNGLAEMAKEMNLETQKGDIDYKIFEKDSWSDEETAEIKKYLQGDVAVTRQMFDITWDYWHPFTQFISQRNIDNFSWIKATVAALVYKAACHTMDIDEEYADNIEKVKTEGGGRAIQPTQQEEWGVYYIDVVSLYPHIYSMFNLIAESPFLPSAKEDVWAGNEMFKVNGSYDIAQHHTMSQDLMNKLKERLRLKKEDPGSPLIYTYKIFLNTFYGITRNPVFRNIYTPNSGVDCCYLGRQIHELVEKALRNFGYKVLSGFTDSWFIKPLEGQSRKKLLEDLDYIIGKINEYVPFPQETFKIAIEAEVDYILYVKEKDEYLKNNYVYLSNDQVKIVGLPIKKVNATKLSKLVYKRYIEPRIRAEKQGRFPRKYLMDAINYELEQDISLMAQEYNVSAAADYASENCIQAQISSGYLDGQKGIVSLIKNKKLGNVGKKMKYCKIEETKDLEISDLDLTKVFKELSPFCEEVLE